MKLLKKDILLAQFLDNHHRTIIVIDLVKGMILSVDSLHLGIREALRS